MRPVCTVVAYSVVYVCLYDTDYLCDGNTGEYCTNGSTDRNAVWGDPGVTFTPPDEYDGSRLEHRKIVISRGDAEVYPPHRLSAILNFKN